METGELQEREKPAIPTPGKEALATFLAALPAPAAAASAPVSLIAPATATAVVYPIIHAISGPTRQTGLCTRIQKFIRHLHFPPPTCANYPSVDPRIPAPLSQQHCYVRATSARW